jgi:GxxExxY protein
MDEDTLSNQIIGAAIEVHKQLGYGLLESAYSEGLAIEFGIRAIPFEKEKVLPVMYKGHQLPLGFRADFLIGGLVIVEVKAVSALNASHEAQIMNYLKLSGCKLGLLLNFHVSQIRYGIRRIVNGLPENRFPLKAVLPPS